MNRRTDQQRDRLAAFVFVCTHDRDSYACCADAGGDAVLEEVTDWLRDRNAFWSPIGVTTTGCLGLCSEAGTALSIQPRDEWYADVQPEDVPALLEAEFGPDADRVDRARE